MATNDDTNGGHPVDTKSGHTRTLVCIVPGCTSRITGARSLRLDQLRGFAQQLGWGGSTHENCPTCVAQGKAS